MSILGDNTPIKLPTESAPQLIVVIDTEEEFDWSAPADRNETSVSAMLHIDRVQSIFDEFGIKPCYVIDYPVATQEEGVRLLKEYFQSDRCEIGAHLHPWVSPPHHEKVTAHNTYAGNLPFELELEKLNTLSQAIENAFDSKPTIYKAGRYGLGPNSSEILEKLGYEIDLSVCPPIDHGADGGPDYSHDHAEPFWFGTSGNMLEIPLTGAFVGWAGGASLGLYNLATRLNKFKAQGILSKLNAVDRLTLTPEGFSTDEHIKLTKFLFDRGVRTFTWSFHSTSATPGAAPYVRDENDLAQFLNSFRLYFEYFFNSLSGEATTPTALKNKLELLA